jgi:hypothetical protein
MTNMLSRGRLPGNGSRFRTSRVAVRALTQVREEFIEGRHNYRLLFGRPQFTRTVLLREGYGAKLNYLPSGSRFAHGTVRWRCFICEAVRPADEAECVPYVAPAARILLSTKGAAQSRLFLAWLAGIVEEGIDPLTCPADFFLAAHFRLHGLRADQTSPERLSGQL